MSRHALLTGAAPLPAPLRPLALPLSFAYGVAVALRNARYDRGFGVRALPIPTISVGNIVVGGTGKSPVVGWIAQALREMGHRPLIALRGYGSANPELSDEAQEHRRRDPDVPVIVGADRHAAVTEALRSGVAADCAILDDGFQHRRLHRDLDLVLVDARSSALDGRLLPAGWLREPPRALRRADAVIVTHSAAMESELAATIVRHHGREPLAWTDHVWDGLEVHRTDGAGELVTEMVPTAWLRGRRIVTMLGIAEPSSVIRAAEAAGATVTSVAVRDHEPYDAGSIARFADRLRRGDAAAGLVTAKDWAKLRPLLDSAGRSSFAWPIVVPRLRIAVISGADAVRGALRSILPPTAPSPPGESPMGIER